MVNIICTSWSCLCLVLLPCIGSTSVSVRKPYGPLMCERLCQRTGGCSFYIFNPSDLSCTVSTDKTRPQIKEKGGVKIVKLKTETSPRVKCSKSSQMVDRRTQPAICVTMFQSTEKRTLEVDETKTTTDPLGTQVQPGDVISFGSTMAVYVGNQEMIGCSKADIVVKESVVKKRFMIHSIVTGTCKVFAPQDRVIRANSRIGIRIKEGDKLCKDGEFVFWVLTGQTWGQAYKQGFKITI